MSKNIKIAALGIAAFATAAAPMMAMAAENEFVDNISITIDKTCTLTRATAAHAAEGENHGTWDNSTDTLSKTLVAGTAVLDLGSSNFKVVCNNLGGHKVTFAATSLHNVDHGDGVTTHDIVYSNATVADTASTWNAKVKIGASTTSLKDSDVVYSKNSTTGNAGDTFSIIYGVGVKDGQPSGSYTGTATYTLYEL